MAESSMKDISLRIKSIKSTKQITKAMELVATSKLAKSKELIKKSRIFHEEINAAMNDIISKHIETSSPYLIPREVKKTCYVVIAGDRGLAGGYNSNIFKLVEKNILDKNTIILPIGRRIVEYCKRREMKVFSDDFSIIEKINVGNCHEIADLLTNAYLKNEFDEVYIIYTNYITALNQEAKITKLLPLDKKYQENGIKKEYILFEPNSNAVLNEMIPSYIAGMVWGSVNESLTSELAARRVAMESATK
ncbi:MAG TPA: ATP synthase F1 subunit gamma, partial [Clostridiales bacterium]|nr:ATP synthase F1 subunit gamma [Clostridiales bacterium]